MTTATVRDDWTDGLIHRIRRGASYYVGPKTMVEALSAKAKSMGCSLWYEYRKRDQSIRFQFETDRAHWVPNFTGVRYVRVGTK